MEVNKCDKMNDVRQEEKTISVNEVVVEKIDFNLDYYQTMKNHDVC